jgi:hypothetical protein
MRCIVILALGLFGLVSAVKSNEVAFEEATRTCKEIGFKPTTEKFQNCVLEIYDRRKVQASTGAKSQQFTDNNVASECEKIGLLVGSSDFSQCYLQLSMIKSQQAAQQAALEQQQREAKKANDLQKAEILLKIAEQGFGMAAGSKPARQGIAGPTITPITPFRFVTPSGNSYNCSTFGVTLTCR